jgi:serine/threonine-protein kinase
MSADELERLTLALAGNYRVERELGTGGMATVYLAEDLKHRRRVAIKVLKPQLTAPVGAERFLREIEATANRTSCRFTIPARQTVSPTM